MYFLTKKLTINNVIGKLGSCVMIFYLKEQKKHNNLFNDEAHGVPQCTT